MFNLDGGEPHQHGIRRRKPLDTAHDAPVTVSIVTTKVTGMRFWITGNVFTRSNAEELRGRHRSPG